METANRQPTPYRQDIEKALSASSVGSILMQPDIDKIIAMLVDYQNPFRQNLTRKPGSGDAWKLRERTAAGTTPAAFVLDTSDLVEDTGTYANREYPYKTIATRGKVTRRAQAQGRTYVDVLAEELEGKTIEWKDYEDKGVVVGTTSTGAAGVTGSAAQFDGLRFLIPSTQQVICGTTAQGPLTLAKLDEAIDKNIGNPDMLYMSRRSRRQLNALLQAIQAPREYIEVIGGFKLAAYSGIPIFISTNIVNTQLCDTSAGVTTAAGSEISGNSSTIYVLDKMNVWIGELTPLQALPLAKSSSQYDEFDIFADEVLVSRNYLKISKLVGIQA